MRDDECGSGEGTIFYDVSLNLFPDRYGFRSAGGSHEVARRKKARRVCLVRMQQDVDRGLLIAQALESLCQELDKEYAAILYQKSESH